MSSAILMASDRAAASSLADPLASTWTSFTVRP
jgi:hypothetical protein